MSNNTNINTLSSKVNEIVEVKEGKWTEVVKRQVDKNLESVSENIEVVQNSLCETRAIADEKRDKENRRNNVILYNATESTGVRAEDRSKNDAAFSLQLFNKLQVRLGVSEVDLVRVSG